MHKYHSHIWPGMCYKVLINNLYQDYGGIKENPQETLENLIVNIKDGPPGGQKCEMSVILEKLLIS